MLVWPPDPVSEVDCVPPLPLLLLHAPIVAATTPQDRTNQVEFFM